MAMKVQVRRRGVVTLPAKLRRQYGIESGDVFQILDLDGIFVLSPTAPMVPLLAAEIEKCDWRPLWIRPTCCKPYARCAKKASHKTFTTPSLHT